MNKFYAIIGTALVAAGSIATANAKVSLQKPADFHPETLQVTAEGQARLNAAQAFAKYEVENGIQDRNTIAKKSWSDGSKTWDLTLINSGALTDFFNVSESAKAYYGCWNVVLATFSSYTNDNNYETYCIGLTYPLQSLWQYIIDQGWITGATSPADILGDKYTGEGLTPLSCWDNELDPDYFYFTCAEAGDDGIYLGFCTEDDWGMAIINTSYSSYYTYQSMGYCDVVKNGKQTLGGPTVGTTLKFSNFDEETISIDAALEGGATTTVNGSAYASYNIPFSGEFNNRGMIEGITKNIEIGEVHIINTGIANYDNVETYDVDWDADLTRYYIMGCHPSLTIRDDAFSTDTYTTTGALSALQEDYTYQFFYGAVYSAADATDPLNIWKGHYINVQKGAFSYETTNAPVADSFVYGGWNSTYAPFCNYDGLRIIDQDHYLFLDIDEDMAEDEKPIIMNGTTDGFGVAGINNYSEYTKLHFNGDIIYHYDSNDYTKTRTLASVGSLATPAMWGGDSNGVQTVLGNNANTNVTTSNGAVNVTVDADTVVVIYNVAGQAVKSVNVAAGQTKTIALGNGLYIVKAGNNAVKVAL
jgi:hypothetical protein